MNGYDVDDRTPDPERLVGSVGATSDLDTADGSPGRTSTLLRRSTTLYVSGASERS